MLSGLSGFTLLYSLLSFSLFSPFVKVYIESHFCQVSFCMFKEGPPTEFHGSSLNLIITYCWRQKNFLNIMP